MTAPSAQERVLALHNPFRDSAVRHGYDAPEDVPEIHAEAREQLRALIEESRREERPRLQVVTGEPGDGKTHLLACLRAAADASWRTSKPVSLVPIDPLREVDAPFVHLLRGWAGGAARELDFIPPESGAPAAPLEFLLWRILRRAAASLTEHSSEPVSTAARMVASLDPNRWPTELAFTLQEHWAALAEALRTEVPRRAPFAAPQVDAEVWQAICRFPEPGHSLPVCRWLSGQSLPEEALAALGVSEPLDSEDRAFRALTTLANLSDVPLVLGLDQLEGVRRLGDDAVRSLFDALTTLYSSGGRLVVLLFCQAAVWADLRKGIAQHALDRLEPREITLGVVTPDLGEKIVERRLAPLWRSAGAAPPHPTAPYPPGWVRAEIVKNGLLQPRRILSFFGQVGLTDRPPGYIAPPVRPPPIELVKAAFAELRGELARQERAPDDRAVLAQASLTGALERAAGKKIGETLVVAARRHKVSKRAKEGVEARLAREGREVRVYAEVHNSQNGRAATAAVKRLEQALASQADRALLIREEPLPLPKAAETRLTQLGPRGGVVHVPMAAMLDLGAVEKLLDAVAAGELDLGEAEAREVIDASIVPELEVVRRFLDGAFAEKATARAEQGTARAAIEAALERPPHAASAAGIARESGHTVEQIGRAAEQLERDGAVQVVTDKEGARGIVRRPR